MANLRKIERRYVGDIGEALSGQRRAVVALVRSSGVVVATDRLADTVASDDRLRAAIYAAVAGSGLSGVRAVASQWTARAGIENPELAIGRWASRYSFRAVNGINRTTVKRSRQIMLEWMRSGEHLSDLTAKLAPIFGETRAELIASTEVTRAYAEGNLTAWEAAGFNRRPVMSEIPPAHGRCRCWITLDPAEGGGYNYVWNTAMDDRVCPICAPRDQRIIGWAGNPDR